MSRRRPSSGRHRVVPWRTRRASVAARGAATLLVTLLLSPTARTQDPAPLLRLDEAIRQVVARGTLVADARDEAVLAAGQLALARSSVMPKFVVGGDGSFGTSSLANQTYSVGASQQLPTGTRLGASVGAQSLQNQLGTFYASQTAIRVTQPLWRGFGGQAFRREVDAAVLRSDDANRRIRLAEQQAIVAMASAYFRIAAEGRRAEVADQSLLSARTLLEAAEAKLAIGRVSRLDVVRAQQLVLAAEFRALEARGAVDDAKDQVRLLLRRSADWDFVVEREIPTVPPPPPLEEVLAVAVANRIELVSAAARVREGEISVAAAADARRPQLDLTLQLTRQAVANSLRRAFGDSSFQVATFAGVSVPFDPMPGRTARQSAEVELRRRVRVLEDLRLQVDQDVRAAHRDVGRLRRMLDQVDAAVTFAREEVELAATRYTRGVTDNLEVIAAEGGLLAAQAERFGVLAELAVAHVRLLASLGTLDPERGLFESGWSWP